MKNLFTLILFAAMAGLITMAATPNFIDAQVRQRLALARADLPVLAAAVEAYKVDHGKYPYDGYSQSGPPAGFNFWYLPFHMTTPVAYLSGFRTDPFRADSDLPPELNNYRYINIDSTWGTDYFLTSPSIYLDEVTAYWGGFHLVSAGPDEVFGPTTLVGWYSDVINYPGFNLPYDPTNGLVSDGDLDLGQKYPVYLE
jgi:hypothetical protein